MRRAIVTMGSGDYAQLLELSRPRMQEYGRLHGWEYIELSGLPPVRPASWLKIQPLIWMLETEYDEVLWLGCDVLIVDMELDIGAQVPAGAWQGIVAHHTHEGEIPNCDVWLLRKPMAKYLRLAWEMEQYIFHKWWEQKAILDLMGYGGSPLHAERATDLYQHTHFLPLAWNSHESNDRASNPIFVHATYGDLRWRLDVFRQHLKKNTTDDSRLSDIRERAKQIDWWHGGIDLGGGVITQGRTTPALSLLPHIALPNDLTGKSVLDVGTFDGFLAFECERRGARRVVAVDSFAWEKPNGRDGFNLAHECRKSKVEPVHCDVLNMNPSDLGTFDIVLFLGVIYHMRHPLLALEKVAALTNGLLIVESYIDSIHPSAPAMRFFPKNELNDDFTNWWGPNESAIIAMLNDVGFSTAAVVGRFGNRSSFHATNMAMAQ